MRVDVEDCEFDDALVLYQNKPLTGVLYSEYDDGSLEEELSYSGGLPHGECNQWYPSGELKSTWKAINGRAEGEYKEFYENGSEKLVRVAEYGVTLSIKEYSNEGELNKDWMLPESDHMYQYVKDCRKENATK